MENFYTDNKDLQFHFENMDISGIITLKEADFSESELFPDAPGNSVDAKDNCRKVLELVGEICGENIAPRAEEVDKEGATFKEGTVRYAAGTSDALKRLGQAGLMGFTLPRKYGGLNLPKTIYIMSIEMVSRADAALMNLYGLQGISEIINHFGTEEQREKYLPGFCRGDITGAMALTEPDAGSDLPSARLKAWVDENGNWYLNGVKRFITNGCAEVMLVMGRSEADIDDARGLSLFIYEKDEKMKIRRIEEKLGIHGSPTCELQFNDAPAELLGVRKRGLIKYTMELMNGARLGVSAQALGIAEAAFREANTYAMKRIQFNQTINKFEPVYEMLTNMRVNIEAARTLLYESARIVDLKEGIEKKIDLHSEKKLELKADLRIYSQYENLFTPMLKCYVTEMGNKLCYDAIQVHGGVGYTSSFNSERHYRDIRITSIYEGTTQLQVVAAAGAIHKGLVSHRLDYYEGKHDLSSLGTIYKKAKGLREQLEKGLKHLQEKEDTVYQQYHSRRIVDMAADTIIGYLICIDSLKSDRKKTIADFFLSRAGYEMESELDYILSDDTSLINLHEEILEIP